MSLISIFKRLVPIVAITVSAVFCAVDKEPMPQHYNYRGAGQQMKRIYYGDLQETIYCGCKYNDKKKVDYSSCNFRPRKIPGARVSSGQNP